MHAAKNMLEAEPSEEGGLFQEPIIELVWQKAKPALGVDANAVRVDDSGNVIVRNQYGTTTKYGWTIRRLRPTALGGTDDLANLVPSHWRPSSESTSQPRLQGTAHADATGEHAAT